MSVPRPSDGRDIAINNANTGKSGLLSGWEGLHSTAAIHTPPFKSHHLLYQPRVPPPPKVDEGRYSTSSKLFLTHGASQNLQYIEFNNNNGILST